MSKLSEKTLRVIAARGIRPQSAWLSKIHDTVYRIGTFVLAVFSAFATAFIFHALLEIDWGAYSRANFSWIDVLASGVPLLSLFLLIAFLSASISLWRRTRRGYRWSTVSILALLIGTAGLTGYLLEYSELDEPIEAYILHVFPHSEYFENSLRPSAKRQWSQPEKGLLGGTVITADAHQIMLLDSRDTLWDVDYSSADIATDVTLQSNETIMIIGQQADAHTFQASEIRHWKRSREQKPVTRNPREDETSQSKFRDREINAGHEDEQYSEKRDWE